LPTFPCVTNRSTVRIPDTIFRISHAPNAVRWLDPATSDRAATSRGRCRARWLAKRVDRATRRRLGRSLSIREVDAGSCNGCELEIHALNNAFYDLERFGLRFVASPRHADVLLVTGPVTKNMREALERTYNATPDPKWVVAVGDCAVDGGIFAGSYAIVGGVDSLLPVDVHIRGCPPRPRDLLSGLLALLDSQTRG
jgi:Ni,Fe-hydrogenase III small subunit